MKKELAKKLTLSELIEACGDEFKELKHNEFFLGGKWYAMGHWSDEGDIVKTYGDTPEEAVINLYLKLNQLNIKK